MDILLYTIIFIIGTFFGSFFTLAVYRIPRKEDILIKHSYCPNCNSKLGFFDLFPVLSYILLGGKCRYCKNKIRPRYLILEILSGLSFLLLTISAKLNVNNMQSIINISFSLLYVSVLFIIAGIDKENIKIEKSVLVFGFSIELLYIIYQYTLYNISVYQYVMYLSIFVIGLLMLRIILKSNKNKQYILQNFYLSIYILVFSGINIYMSTIILSLLISLLYKNTKKQMPFGFYLGIINILFIAISNIITNYVI